MVSKSHLIKDLEAKTVGWSAKDGFKYTLFKLTPLVSVL